MSGAAGDESPSSARARTARELIAAAPDLTVGEARELARIMDYDADGMPPASVRNQIAVARLLELRLITMRADNAVATDDGARAYVRHVKLGRTV